ncbi:hypothetical protein Tco_0734440 [Tanacetum coccineum]
MLLRIAVGNSFDTGVNIEEFYYQCFPIFSADDVSLLRIGMQEDKEKYHIEFSMVISLFNYLGLPLGSNMKSIASWKDALDKHWHVLKASTLLIFKMALDVAFYPKRPWVQGHQSLSWSMKEVSNTIGCTSRAIG